MVKYSSNHHCSGQPHWSPAQWHQLCRLKPLKQLSSASTTATVRCPAEKSPWISKFFWNVLIDINIFKNVLVDIDIFKNDLLDINISRYGLIIFDVFKKCRYIDN